MVSAVTSEVVNESDSEVVLKRGNGGVYVILSKLTGRGDRFTIKTEPNATYQEYKLVGTSSDGSMPFLITSDDCIEHERIIIKRDRVAMIRRGMSVTEVVNLTRRDFTVKQGTMVIEVLKAEGEYLIQRDPKGKSEAYSLVEGENPPIVISVEDLVNNQRITVFETSTGNPALSTAMVRRGLYLTEVCNRTDTSFTVKYREGGEGSNPSTELATLEGGMNKSVTIEYDPTTRNREDWVDSDTQTLFITSEDFVKSKRIDIIKRDSSPSAKLECVELRPVPTPTPKKTLLSKIYEWF